ncbi:olfactory receptor 12 [Sigmodon hispidus]
MSYDRYVAICNPLHYPLVMNQRKCTQLAASSWLSGIPIQIGQTCWIFSMHFCNSNEIDHFFCDIPPILKLACGDTSVHELSVYVVVMVVAALPFILVLTSYSKIIATILRLPTAKGRAKAFSTCSSHLLVVVLFYGSAQHVRQRKERRCFRGSAHGGIRRGGTSGPGTWRLRTAVARRVAKTFFCSRAPLDSAPAACFGSHLRAQCSAQQPGGNLRAEELLRPSSEGARLVGFVEAFGREPLGLLTTLFQASLLLHYDTC